MTFEVTVTKLGGEPIPFALVQANDEATGKTFSRGTDGNGYANVALFDVADGTPMTLSVVAGGYKNAILYPTTTKDNQTIAVVLGSFKKPFRPAPRLWNGVSMCGARIEGLPPVSGGADDASLFLSWFYHLYDYEWRRALREHMKDPLRTHWLLSWPDARAAGLSPAQFRDICLELVNDGFYPCVMLSSKDFDPKDVPAILDGLAELMPLLVGLVPMFCVGWELSLWLSPTQVQQLIDALFPVVQEQPGTLLYVHFQQGYGSFQQPGHFFADFWNLNVGKLTGLLHQKIQDQTPEEYRSDSGGLTDILIRFAGGAGCSAESGFGHPFDCVALEITAMGQFNGTVTEAQGNALAQWAIDTPPVTGPTGVTVRVMGAGN